MINEKDLPDLVMKVKKSINEKCLEETLRKIHDTVGKRGIRQNI